MKKISLLIVFFPFFLISQGQTQLKEILRDGIYVEGGALKLNADRITDFIITFEAAYGRVELDNENQIAQTDKNPLRFYALQTMIGNRLRELPEFSDAEIVWGQMVRENSNDSQEWLLVAKAFAKGFDPETHGNFLARKLVGAPTALVYTD